MRKIITKKLHCGQFPYGFWATPPDTLQFTPQILWEVKSFYRPSERHKQSFFAYSGLFFMDYSAKCDPICINVLPGMYCKVMHHICHGFLMQSENS